MKYIFLLLTIGSLLSSVSNAQLKVPAPSPSQTIKQDFALSSVEVSYSRPGMKGRKVFGDLVPYGKVWRTGANGATTITFGEDVSFGGKNVPAGKYGLLTIPGANEWTVILSKQLNVTSPAAYKQEEDVVRVTAKAMKIGMPIETFTIGFDDIKPAAMRLYMLWEKTYVEVPVSANIDSKVMAQIQEQMNGDSDKKPYFQAAMYYLENGKDQKQALTWFDKAVEQNPKAFYMQYNRARCLAKLGQKQKALEAAKNSLELSKEAKNDDYVALNEKLIISLNGI